MTPLGAIIQTGAGMLHMHMAAAVPITEQEALARLPHGSSIVETGNGFIAVSLPIDTRAADAFADFCYPFYIQGARLGWPRFAMRRENLRSFVDRWEAWA